MGAVGSFPRSTHGLGYDVVVSLVLPFKFQGYQLYCDNFYSGPDLFQELQKLGIFATGTLLTNRRGVPSDVKKLKDALLQRNVPRGTGYYIRDSTSNLVYVCWKDNKVVCLLSNAHPGHQDGTTKRKIKDPVTGNVQVTTTSLWGE